MDGLSLGGNSFTFVGDFYKEKGCYAYASGSFKGMGFYGNGDIEEMKEDVRSGKYRPEGYPGCPTTGNKYNLF